MSPVMRLIFFAVTDFGDRSLAETGPLLFYSPSLSASSRAESSRAFESMRTRS